MGRKGVGGWGGGVVGLEGIGGVCGAVTCAGEMRGVSSGRQGRKGLERGMSDVNTVQKGAELCLGRS